MEEQDFEKEAASALNRLPKQFRRQLHNIEIVIERRATNRQLREVGLDPERHVLYGLYQGVPLPERSALYPPLLPDKITLFSEPLMRDFPDEADLRREIRRTVVH